MTNPTPRPALRKAGDADVHPAAPRPARSARSASAAAEPVPSPRPPAEPTGGAAAAPEKSAPAGPRPRSATTSATRSARARGRRPVAPVPAVVEETPRRFTGSTSDHLRPEPDVDAKPAREGKKKGAAAAKPSKPAKKPDLMKGKTTELDVEVPKALRKAARARAKSEGLDLDTVVIDLLYDWVTARNI